MPDSDWDLVQRTVAGDQRAYGLLVLKYQRRIQRLIGRMVRDVDLVEDIAQGRAPRPSFADGLRVQRILDAVEKSAAANSTSRCRSTIAACRRGDAAPDWDSAARIRSLRRQSGSCSPLHLKRGGLAARAPRPKC